MRRTIKRTTDDLDAIQDFVHQEELQTSDESGQVRPEDLWKLVPPSQMLSVRTLVKMIPKKLAKNYLSDEYEVPMLHGFDGCPNKNISVRLAWSEEGIFINLTVENRTKKIQCDVTHPKKSDALIFAINTRPELYPKKMNQFCKAFGMMFQTDVNDKTPLLRPMRSNFNEFLGSAGNSEVSAMSKKTKSGYCMQGFLPNQVLPGFETDEQPQFSFSYLIQDCECGTFSQTQTESQPKIQNPPFWMLAECLAPLNKKKTKQAI